LYRLQGSESIALLQLPRSGRLGIIFRVLRDRGLLPPGNPAGAAEDDGPLRLLDAKQLEVAL
jgi:hypothetical protein